MCSVRAPSSHSFPWPPLINVSTPVGIHILMTWMQSSFLHPSPHSMNDFMKINMLIDWKTFKTHNPQQPDSATGDSESLIPASSKSLLILRSSKLPWDNDIGPIGSPPSSFIGKDGMKCKLMNLNVLYSRNALNGLCPLETCRCSSRLQAQLSSTKLYVVHSMLMTCLVHG